MQKINIEDVKSFGFLFIKIFALIFLAVNAIVLTSPGVSLVAEVVKLFNPEQMAVLAASLTAYHKIIKS